MYRGFQSFEFSPEVFTVGVVFALILAVYATAKVIGRYDGVERPVWLLFVWLVPWVGPLISLYCVFQDMKLSDPERKLYQHFLDEAPHHKYLEGEERRKRFNEWRKERGL